MFGLSLASSCEGDPSFDVSTCAGFSIRIDIPCFKLDSRLDSFAGSAKRAGFRVVYRVESGDVALRIGAVLVSDGGNVVLWLCNRSGFSGVVSVCCFNSRPVLALCERLRFSLWSATCERWPADSPGSSPWVPTWDRWPAACSEPESNRSKNTMCMTYSARLACGSSSSEFLWYHWSLDGKKRPFRIRSTSLLRDRVCDAARRGPIEAGGTTVSEQVDESSTCVPPFAGSVSSTTSIDVRGWGGLLFAVENSCFWDSSDCCAFVTIVSLAPFHISLQMSCTEGNSVIYLMIELDCVWTLWLTVDLTLFTTSMQHHHSVASHVLGLGLLGCHRSPPVYIVLRVKVFLDRQYVN